MKFKIGSVNVQVLVFSLEKIHFCVIQGVFFFWPPLNLTKSQALYNLNWPPLKFSKYKNL